MQLRLQVILSRAGVASRRAAENLIEEGKVSVNGKVVTELGSRADPERDVITVSGRKIELNRQNRYILVNKPEGTITSKSDPEGRPTVMNLLPNELQELHPVGRLDWATEGVLLFTDDGALTYALTHPRFEVRREYHVKLKGKLGENDAVRWLEGATLEDGHARADTADILGSTGKHTWLQITLHEGKNREIRRLAEALGYEVQRLRRYSFAGLTIEGVPPGGYRFLDLDEIEKLRQIAKASGAENIEENVVGSPPEGVSRSGQMVETRGHRGAMVYDLTPKGIEPTTQRGTTRLDDFDEDGNLLRRPSAPKPEEHIGRHGTRTWVSPDAKMQRPERPERPEGGWTERFPAREERPRGGFSPRGDSREQRPGGDRPRGGFSQRSESRPGGGFTPRNDSREERPRGGFSQRSESRPGDRPNRDERPRGGFSQRSEPRPGDTRGERPRQTFERRENARPGDRPNRDEKPRGGFSQRSEPRPGGGFSQRSETRPGDRPNRDERPARSEERPRGGFSQRSDSTKRDNPPRDYNGPRSPRPKHRGKTRD